MRSLLLVVALVMGAFACGVDEQRTPVAIEVPSGPFVDATDVRLAGDLDRVLDFDTRPDPSNVFVVDDGDYLMVEGAAEIGDKALMLQFGGRNLTDVLVPGYSASFVFGDYEEDVPDGTLLGCIGQAIDNYDIYDSPADIVDVVVTEPDPGRPSETPVTVTGYWMDQNKVASAEFTLTR